ncbi:hypothetical protein Bhyg_14907, partial [Pseudolycoriella hygida]
MAYAKAWHGVNHEIKSGKFGEYNKIQQNIFLKMGSGADSPERIGR